MKTPTLLGPLQAVNLNHWTINAEEKVEVNLRAMVSQPVCFDVGLEPRTQFLSV